MKIAVLGLGAMGARIAAQLARAGQELRVWNRDAAKAAPLVALGAQAAASPRAAVAGADVALSMVRDDAAARAVWLDAADGALPALPDGALAIECSTLTVAWAREWAGLAGMRGLAALDAPVVGSRPQAEAAQLVFLAGGDAATVERATPLLRTMGAAVHHCGGHGSGAAVKLAVNALFGVQVAALAELLGLLGGNGVDRARAVEIIGSLPVASPAAKVAAGAMLAGNFAPLFPVELLEKDLGYAEAAARAAGHPVPLVDAVRGVMQQAMARGWGGDNLTGVVRLYD